MLKSHMLEEDRKLSIVKSIDMSELKTLSSPSAHGIMFI